MPIIQKRDDFPILQRVIYGKYPLVYLDNAATTQKPRQVVEAMTEEYYNVNANVHRGVHFLSQQATELHEASRETVRSFLNARSTSEIIFTRGTTESINLVASCFGQAFMKAGDEVIVSEMEHHSNIVSWQLMQERLGIRLRVVPITDDGRLVMDEYVKLFNERTRIVSITHVSNVLGTVNPVKDIVRIAHEHNVPVLIDGAQSSPHMKVDVQDLDCDFYAFSGHKIYGPTGIGVLYGKEEWLDRIPPYMGGGEMIKNVSFERTTFNALPYKFEAGTPDYVATTGLARALDYMNAIGLDAIEAHERDLTAYAMQRLMEVEGMHIYGPGIEEHDAVISFQVGNIHHLDMGTLLDRLGIAVRTGHHCAEPLMRRLGIEGTCRASFALYNTREEVDALVEGIRRVSQMF
ncbi:MAG: cysteine desulfurase [Bacteroidaceae bacterium]|nr:cysteine desulfurase [Bacteroidaceae bacterium]MBQ5621821.1 cysteine desulfurase [Bacteroidaceae bacterium]MBR0543749.1 cysteine desulfurase [Bacteroidaceae bacterium]